jgi:methionine-rich copper-binding protein CopC
MKGIRLHVSILAAALVGCLALAPSAGAHAKLQRADPKPGSKIKTVPGVVRAWFSEELDAKGSALSVWDSHGKRKDDGKGGLDLNDLDHKSLIAKLQPIGPGTYTVKWTAVSTDDKDVAKGSFRFTVASAMGMSMSGEALPPLMIVSPARGATIGSPLSVVFETPADLPKMTIDDQMSGSHLHIDLDKKVAMPTMKQLAKVGANRYQYDLGQAAPGSHTIRVYWADEKHKPTGSVQVVVITVK